MLKSLFLKVENPDVERAISMTVVNRLLVSGSDRFCERWRRDYYTSSGHNFRILKRLKF
jgi:hypothetical protein